MMKNETQKPNRLAKAIVEGKNVLSLGNLQYFAEEPPATPPAGADTTPPTGETTPPATPPTSQPAGETQTPATPPTDKPGSEEKTFKQEDVNAIVAKNTKAAQEKILKQLGMEDFDTAKQGLEQFRQWQEDQKTEAQKQADALQNYQTQAQSLTEENSTLKAQLSAVTQGVQADSVGDVVTLAKTMVSDDVTIDDAIAKVVEKYPHFAAKAEETPGEQGGSKPQFSTGTHQRKEVSEKDKWLEAFTQQQQQMGQ